MSERRNIKQQPDSRGKKESRGKILFISYFYPPTAGGGVFRPLAMTRYLSRLGWDITVITSTTPKHYPTDPGLEKQIPENVEVIRIPVVWEGGWFRRLLGKLGLGWIPQGLVTPDERIFWMEKATNKAKKLLKENDFDCLYTTGPPFSVLLGGCWLKREKWMDRPWLAEFRDPWTLAPYLTILNAHHKRFADDTEADIMRLADSVVMVTPSFMRMMREKYPQYAVKVQCVQNGFDEEDFRELPVKDEWHNESCVIAASGTVFGRYNMDDFISGLEQLKKHEQEDYSRIRVLFQGLPNVKLNRRLLEKGLNDRCSARGFVNHAENISDLWTADLLVLPLADVPKSEGHIPSRTYEYLASGTPILAICPDGDLVDILKEFPQVIMVKPGDIDGIVNCIKEAVTRWERGLKLVEPDPNELRRLTRKARAGEIDNILRGLIRKREREK